MVLTDAQRAAPEPLVLEVRPRGKAPHEDLRQTVEAISWRHQNGARWRAIPAERGPWWKAAQAFIRWAKEGGWERLLARVQERAGGADLGSAWPSSMGPAPGRPPRRRARRKGGTGAGRDEGEALGRSRGGYGTKAVAVADGRGRAVAFALAPGPAHEAPMAPMLLAGLPRSPRWAVGGRGLSPEALRARIRGMGARPAIPAKRNEASAARCPGWIYVNRNRVARLWGRLKGWRAVATRHEKTARSFVGVLCLAATIDWIRR